MNEYAKNLKPVKLRRKLNESGTPVPLLESEMNQIRGANGSIQWLATQGRPELAAASSIIPSGFPSPTSQLVSDINHVIKTAKDLTYELRIWPIPASERRHCAFFDASYDNKGERNQLGVIIGCCSTKLNRGVEDTFSLGFWKSSKLEQSKQATSPNYTETKAAYKATMHLTWYKVILGILTYSDFDLETLRRPGESPPHWVPYVVSAEDPLAEDPMCILIGDSKGGYDNLRKEQPGAERFSALDAAPMKLRLKEIGGVPRWLPHDRNPADALTKFRGAHVEPLIRMLKTGKFQLKSETVELERKKLAKETLGYIPRPKTGVRAVAYDQKQQQEVAQAMWAVMRCSL